MRVYLLNPRWRFPCSVCESCLVSFQGVFKRDAATGALLDRGPLQPTPCSSCPKPPTWAKSAGKDWKELRLLARELSPENRKALSFWHRCKAVNKFPDDPLVAWYSGVIDEVTEDVSAQWQDRQHQQGKQLADLIVLALRDR